jgi:ATP-dependent exoDNAse (exonuclease V) alpha subunit
MNINKSQGQTFDFVGLHMPSPVFSHGQLYVTMSRVEMPTSL